MSGTGVTTITVTYHNGKKDRIKSETVGGRLVVEKRPNNGEPILAVVEKFPGGAIDLLAVPFDAVKGTSGRTKKEE